MFRNSLSFALLRVFLLLADNQLVLQLDLPVEKCKVAEIRDVIALLSGGGSSRREVYCCAIRHFWRSTKMFRNSLSFALQLHALLSSVPSPLAGPDTRIRIHRHTLTHTFRTSDVQTMGAFYIVSAGSLRDGAGHRVGIPLRRPPLRLTARRVKPACGRTHSPITDHLTSTSTSSPASCPTSSSFVDPRSCVARRVPSRAVNRDVRWFGAAS